MKDWARDREDERGLKGVSWATGDSLVKSPFLIQRSFGHKLNFFEGKEAEDGRVAIRCKSMFNSIHLNYRHIPYNFIISIK